MITTDFETFAQLYKEMVWTKRPTQKINEKGVSSQWEGTHTRFKKIEPPPPRKKWHIGNGHKGYSKKNYECALGNSCGYISGCTEDYVSVRTGKKAPGRTKQFNDFIEKANEGDIIFLHYKNVTHWGIYSGEILSYREGFNSPDHIPKGWLNKVKSDPLVKNDIFHIKVEKWIPISKPFSMFKRLATLFEVTDKPEYKIQ